MNYETLLFEVRDHVAYLTLNRPDNANSLNMQMGRELMQVSIRCDEDPDIRAVLMTGAGKMFAAGGDLKSFAAMGDQIGAGLKELTLYFHGAVSRFARMNAPLITAVNGTAAGAGFSLAMAGDLVLAAESAWFTMAYTAAALSPDGSSTYFVPRLIGIQRTKELMLTNRRLTAQEAFDWGLVSKVVADDELMTEAEKLAQKLAQGPTLAYGSVKKLLNETFSQSLETQMELEARQIVDMVKTHDAREGIDAFTNKRKPDYRGT
jgi:2-(1,2-epoxy-1,2-dihydrophenyl)acetyl-CoA isomerase